MISVEQGLEIVLSRARSEVSDDFMPVEAVDLASSPGRILRESIAADADSPPFDRSIRDGFALKAADVASVPATLRIVGESRAGRSFDGTLRSGECAEIMTGAAVPAGADAVVMVEDTERLSDGETRILECVPAGRSIQARATEAVEGDRILESGRIIGLADVGILASTGHAVVRVSRRPRVAIVSTGDELVNVDETPGPDQIRNSNSFTLRAQVEAAGGDANVLEIARDRAPDLNDKIAEGLQADVLIASGGVSMGKYDLVAGALTDLGVDIAFERVAMKPGKPTVFGSRGRTFVFGLPGNPVSTIVSFQLFVRPLIRLLLHAPDVEGTLRQALLTDEARCDPARAACVPAHVRFEKGAYRLTPVRWKGSSDLVGLSRANAYVMIPQRKGTLNAGERVQFIPM
jgi:molybdopterin molybdotransferase